jgi:hypothetical protein
MVSGVDGGGDGGMACGGDLGSRMLGLRRSARADDQVAPVLASPRAIAFPRPRPDPVTTATRPVRSKRFADEALFITPERSQRRVPSLDKASVRRARPASRRRSPP